MSRCENCIIRQLNALKALSKDELKAISDAKKEKRITKGEVLFKEGEKLRGVFCVRSGASKLSKLNEDGKDHIVKIATSGEVIGKRSLIAEEETSLSAVALEDMDVCYIPKTEITNKIQGNYKFTQELLYQLTQDLKDAETNSINLSVKSVSQRLAHILLYLQERSGLDKEGYIRLALSREDMASFIGTATESCIRLISELKKEGIIETQARRIKIIQPELLKKKA